MAQKIIKLGSNWREDNNQKKEIIHYICAFLNSKNGGTLVLMSPPNEKGFDLKVYFVRYIEQKIGKKMGASSLTECVKVESELNKPSQLSFMISALRSPPYVCTLESNLMLPSDAQIQSTLPCNVNDLRKIIDILDESKVLMDSPQSAQPDNVQRFVRGDYLHCGESKHCQFKFVKSSTNIVSKGNKLASYVSAFANYDGGYIYYGVKDDGFVEGQTLKDETKDKKSIIDKVTKVIKGMKRPARWQDPEMGKYWKIYFIPVYQKQDDEHPSTYVIVIKVMPCPGGVFTSEPESYILADGEVQKMSFDEWKRRILKSKPFLLEACALTEQCTLEMGEDACKITEKLVKLRNDGSFDKFDEEAKRLLKEANKTRLVVLSQLAAVAVRKGHFKEAVDLNEEYACTLSKLTPACEVSKDFKAKELYTSSLIMRAEDEVEKSLEIAKEGLKILERIPPRVGLVTAWFNAHCASLLTILARRKPGNADVMKEAQSFAEKALEHAKKLNALPIAKADLKQRVWINQAMGILKCCLTGEMDVEIVVGKNNLKKARRKLKNAKRSFKHFKPTKFCKIQYYFARSDYCFRKTNSVKAKKKCEKAEKLSQKRKFEGLERYAKKRLKVLETASERD